MEATGTSITPAMSSTSSTASVRHVGTRWIVAHRGLWSDRDDRNSLIALTEAVEAGFGVETDIRDLGASLSIRHDPAEIGVAWSEAWGTLRGCKGRLAFNVKADGLIRFLEEQQPLPESVFFFDMSWPQTLEYVRAGLPVALRVSEWEPLNLTLFERLAVPVRLVLDAFESDWWLGDETVREASLIGEVMMISPELHGRDPRAAWDWAAERIEEGGRVSVCTDRCLDLLKVLS